MQIETKTTVTKFTATKARLTSADIIDLMEKAGVLNGKIESFEVEVNGVSLDDEYPISVLVVHESTTATTLG